MNARPQSQWILQIALTAIALYLCWMILKPFLSVLLWATVLTIVFYPAFRWWRERLKRPTLAAMVTTLLVIVTIIAPMVAVITAVINELQGVASTAQGRVTAIIADPQQDARVRQVLALAEQYLGLDEARVMESLQQGAAAASQFLVQGTLNVVGGALGLIVGTFFVMFTMYYLFKDGERAVRVLREMLPLEEPRSERLIRRTGDIISASVYGIVVIAIVQGALGGLMFWFLGLPSPLVWGVVMTVLSAIPLLGTFLVWVPAAIFLAVTGHWVKAVILTAWGALVIGMVDNFLRPQLVGQRARMHELLIFFSVLGGMKVFGVLGLLVGPVVLALGLALLEAFRDTGDEPQAVVVVGDQSAVMSATRLPKPTIGNEPEPTEADEPVSPL